MLEVGTGKARESNDLLTSLARGRDDHQFFSQTFLGRTLHDGQLEFVENANATINALATANRYGKTTVLLNRHYHGNIYKIGGEPRYLDPVTGQINQDAWLKLKYNTIHTADLFETVQLVWDDAHKVMHEQPMLFAFIAAAPRSLPPHIDFIHGARWKFRTLGHDASGIDGNSFYRVSIDEAGWVMGLEPKMTNVIRVRVADVQGMIDLVGTFKPGISRDFYKICVRASAYTGRAITFDHRTDEDDDGEASNLDSSIKKYLREFFAREVARGNPLSADLEENLAKLGISASEFTDAATRGGH